MEKEKRKPIGYFPPGCKETNRHKKTSSRMRGGQSNLNVFLLAKSNANLMLFKICIIFLFILYCLFLNYNTKIQNKKEVLLYILRVNLMILRLLRPFYPTKAVIS